MSGYIEGRVNNISFMFYQRRVDDPSKPEGYRIVTEEEDNTAFLDEYRKPLEKISTAGTYKEKYEQTKNSALAKLKNKKNTVTAAIALSAAARLGSSAGSTATIIASAVVFATATAGIGIAIAAICLGVTAVSVIYSSHQKRKNRKILLDQIENKPASEEDEINQTKVNLNHAEDAASFSSSTVGYGANPPAFPNIPNYANFLSFAAIGSCLSVIEYLADKSISNDDKEILLLQKYSIKIELVNQFEEKQKKSPENLDLTEKNKYLQNKVYLDNYCRLQNLKDNNGDAKEIERLEYFLSQCLLLEELERFNGKDDAISEKEKSEYFKSARICKEDVLNKINELKTFIYKFNKLQQYKELPKPLTETQAQEHDELASSLNKYYDAVAFSENDPRGKIVDPKAAVKSVITGTMMGIGAFALGASIALMFCATAIPFLLPLIGIGAAIVGLFAAVSHYKSKSNSSLAGTIMKGISMTTSPVFTPGVAVGAALVGGSTVAVNNALCNKCKLSKSRANSEMSLSSLDQESRSGSSTHLEGMKEEDQFKSSADYDNSFFNSTKRRARTCCANIASNQTQFQQPRI